MEPGPEDFVGSVWKFFMPSQKLLPGKKRSDRRQVTIILENHHPDNSGECVE